jgi:hypothetical protein
VYLHLSHRSLIAPTPSQTGARPGLKPDAGASPCSAYRRYLTFIRKSERNCCILTHGQGTVITRRHLQMRD